MDNIFYLAKSFILKYNYFITQRKGYDYLNRTEENIIKKSIELFKKYGYNETSINVICEECGITKGTFYYHFNAKSELIFHYYEVLFNNIMTIMPELITMKDSKKKLWKLYEYSIDNTVSLSPELLKAMLIADAENGLEYFSPLKAGTNSTSRQMNTSMLRELVIQAQEEGTIHSSKNPDKLLQTYNAVIIGMALDWSCSHGNYDQKQELKAMFDIVFS